MFAKCWAWEWRSKADGVDSVGLAVRFTARRVVGDVPCGAVLKKPGFGLWARIGLVSVAAAEWAESQVFSHDEGNVSRGPVSGGNVGGGSPCGGQWW